ncbi:MAG: AzlC family ABC transporter permease [Eubacterium sp.]|nr:AzlC family ABC transporter permease [Eubacterium sp.]
MKQAKENTFLKGIIDGIPICLGYLSVAFAFGIFSVSNGLTAAEALLISMTNVTSAGQLAAVPIMVSGGTLIELALSQFVINMRYALMSVSLSQKLDGTVKMRDRFLIAFINTDEVFAVASSKKEVGRTYMFGLILTPYIGWSAGTIIGAVAGSILPTVVISALGIAIYGMFIAIVVPVAKEDKHVLLCVIMAIAMSCAFRYMPLLSTVQSGFVIIICSVVAAGIAAWLFPVDTENKEGKADEL